MPSTQEAVLTIYKSLDAETRAQMIDILREMVAQQERERAALYKAIEHAPSNCISRGIGILKGASILGEPVMSTYSNCPQKLIGLAFAAGIAEGKQRERARRRQGEIKNKLREEGQLHKQIGEAGGDYDRGRESLSDHFTGYRRSERQNP